MSGLQYFNYALPIWKVENLAQTGPAPQIASQEPVDFNYLASDYWLPK